MGKGILKNRRLRRKAPLSLDQFNDRLRALGIQQSPDGKSWNIKDSCSSRVRYQRFLEWATQKKIPTLLSHDQFVAELLSKGYLVVHTIKNGEEQDHFLVLPG